MWGDVGRCETRRPKSRAARAPTRAAPRRCLRLRGAHTPRKLREKALLEQQRRGAVRAEDRVLEVRLRGSSERGRRPLLDSSFRVACSRLAWRRLVRTKRRVRERARNGRLERPGRQVLEGSCKGEEKRRREGGARGRGRRVGPRPPPPQTGCPTGSAARRAPVANTSAAHRAVWCGRGPCRRERGGR